MAQEHKKKFFYEATSKRSLEEIVSVAEDEIIKENKDEEIQKEMLDLISALKETSKSTDVFFEDKGIIYSLSENPILLNKIKKLN